MSGGWRQILFGVAMCGLTLLHGEHASALRHDHRDDHDPVTATPEPTTLLLLGTAPAGFGAMWRRKSRTGETAISAPGGMME